MIEVKIHGVKELEREIREFGGNLHKANTQGLKKVAKVVSKNSHTCLLSAGLLFFIL